MRGHMRGDPKHM